VNTFSLCRNKRFSIGPLLLAGLLSPIALSVSSADRQSGADVCSGDRLSTSSPTGTTHPQCCQDGQHTWLDTGTGILAHRTDGEACREADGVGTNCGVGSTPFIQCVYGPCGAKTEWRIHAAEIRIFVPESMPSKCGWEARGIVSCEADDPDGCGWQKKGIRFYPEPYNGQLLYPGVTATCPYRRCVAGTPAL